jgi:hypothetical protein
MQELTSCSQISTNDNHVLQRIHFYELRSRREGSTPQGPPEPHPLAELPFIEMVSSSLFDPGLVSEHFTVQMFPGGRVGVLSTRGGFASYLGIWDWQKGVSLGVSVMA